MRPAQQLARIAKEGGPLRARLAVGGTAQHARAEALQVLAEVVRLRADVARVQQDALRRYARDYEGWFGRPWGDHRPLVVTSLENGAHAALVGGVACVAFEAALGCALASIFYPVPLGVAVGFALGDDRSRFEWPGAPLGGLCDATPARGRGVSSRAFRTDRHLAPATVAAAVAAGRSDDRGRGRAGRRTRLPARTRRKTGVGGGGRPG